jgi:hypothetical protein
VAALPQAAGVDGWPVGVPARQGRGHRRGLTSREKGASSSFARLPKGHGARPPVEYHRSQKRRHRADAAPTFLDHGEHDQSIERARPGPLTT